MSRNCLRLLSVLLLVGCAVEPVNPFDPDSSNPAKGVLAGLLVSEAGDPLTGAFVRVTTEGAEPVPVAVAPDGRFQVEVAPGVWQVEGGADAHFEARLAGLQVVAGGRIDVGVMRLTVVRGVVEGRLRLVDGASPAGATVTLVPTGDSKQAFTTTAGPSGDYRVDGVPEGEYVVRAAHLEYAPGYTESQDVDGEARTTFPELTLQPASAVVRAEVDGQIGARFSRSPDVRVLLLAFGDHVREMMVSEDVAFEDSTKGDVDWRQYAASVELVLSPDDGPKTLYARFRDRWSIESPVFSTTITLDRTPPVITTAKVGDGTGWVRALATQTPLKIEAADALSGIAAFVVSTDGELDNEAFETRDAAPGATTLATSADLGTTPGPVPVLVQVRDAAGNLSEVSTIEVVVDAHPPVTGAPAILIHGIVHSRQVEVAFDVTGDTPDEPLFYVLGNASGLPESSDFLPLPSMPIAWTLADGADGLRTVCARFRDAAGNTTDETCRELTLDRTGRIVGTVALEEASATLAGVTVTVTNDAQPGFLAVGTTGDDGQYEVAELPEGSAYVVRLSMAGYEGQTIRPVSVHAGHATPLEAQSLRRARGAVSGTVTLNDRAPGESGGIVVSALNTPYAATTTPTGEFLLRDLPVGSYEISARAQGYVAASFGSVTVAAGRTQALGALQLRRQSGSFAICRTGDGTCALGPQSFTGSRDVLLNLTSTTAIQYRAGTNSDLSEVAFVPLEEGVTTYPFQLDDLDGEQVVYVQYRTQELTEQPPLASSIVLDRAPPTSVSVVIDPDAQGQGAAWTRHPTGQVRLAITAEDAASGVATVRISNDGIFEEAPVAHAAVIAHQLDDATDGLKTVHVVACDRVGNCTDAAAAAVASIGLDRVAPSGVDGYSLQLAGGAATTSSGQISVDLTLGSDAASVRFGTTPTLAGASWIAVEPSSQVSFSLLLPLEDGLKTVFAQFADAAGNLSGLDPAAFSDTITLDRTPPSGTVSIAAGERTNSRTVTLNLGRDADVTGVAFGNSALDCATASYESWPASNTKVWTLPAGDGSKVVVVCFRDAAGNASMASATTLLDMSPPIATANPAVRINAGASHATSVDVTLSFRVSGADTMRVSCDDVLDAEPSQPFVPELSCNLNPTQGVRTVTAVFSDLAGNLLGPVMATITLDTMLPPVPVPTVVPSPTQLVTPLLSWESGGGDTAQYRVQIASNTTFLTLSYDGKQASSSLAWNAPEGTWYWRVAAVDQAGNQSAWSAIQTFRVDRTPPAAPVLTAASATGDSLALAWRAPGDDGNDGHLAAGSSYDLRWRAGATGFAFADATRALGVPVPGPRGTDESFVLTGLAPKTTYQLALRVCDAADNCSEVSPILTTSTSDDTPPAAITNLSGTVGDHSVTLRWTRPGDDGLAGGPVLESTLFYRVGPLATEADFLLAEQVKTPVGSPGTLAQTTVAGLMENTTYSFAVRTRDQAGNDSGPSNVVVLQTSRIDEIRPAAARPGEWIELHGINFGVTQALVSFSGVPSSQVGHWSNTLVRVKVPEQASSGEVRILRGALESGPHPFQVAPVLASAFPREVVAGQSLFLTGRAFGEPGKEDTGVAFGESFVTSKEVADWQDGGTAPVVPDWIPPGVQQVRVRQDGIDSRALPVRVWSEPKTLASGDANVLAVATSPVDGAVHTLYRRQIDATYTYIYARRLAGPDAVGWDSEQYLTYASTAAVQIAQGDLDVDALGTAHACFIVQRVSGSNRSATLYYARRPPGGSWSSLTTLHSLTQATSTYPALNDCRVAASAGATASQTAVLVVWTEGLWSSLTAPSRLWASGSVNGGGTFAARTTICPDGACSGSNFEGLPDISAINSHFYRGWHLVYGRKTGVSGSIDLRAAWSSVGSAVAPFNFGAGRRVKNDVVSTVRPVLARVDSRYGWYPQSATYLAWNDSGDFGQSVWVTRVGESQLSADLIPSGFVKVDETASEIGARPSLSATRDGDLSVIVTGSEQAAGGTDRVVRHHVLRWNDSGKLVREAGDEIGGVAAGGAVLSGAGAEGRVAMVWTAVDAGVWSIKAAWTRLPHREAAPVQVLAAPATGLHVGPRSTIGADGTIHTAFWHENQDTNPFSVSLRVVRETEKGVVTERAGVLGTGTVTSSCSMGDECRTSTAMATLPDGRAAMLSAPPAAGSRTLSLCVDLMSCTPEKVATGAFDTLGLTADASGALHLVYARPTGGVYYRRWADGVLGDELRVDQLAGGQPEPGVSLQPVVVAGPSGTAFVIYGRVYGLNTLRARTITRSDGAPDGYVRSESVELVASAFPLEHPSAAWSDDGIELLWHAGGRSVMRGRWLDAWIEPPAEVIAEPNMRVNTVLADAAGQTFVYLDTNDPESYDWQLASVDLDRRLGQPATVGAFADVTRGANAVAVDPRGRLVVHGLCDQGWCGGRLMRATYHANE